MNSRLAVLGGCSRERVLDEERGHPRQELLRRATAGAVRGVRTSRGRARGSFRLQKSTSGVRPITAAGEEPADPTLGLALRRESAARVKERWKPARRWQNRETGGGRRVVRASGLRGAFVDGRRSGSGKPLSLTRERWKRSWHLEDARVHTRVVAGRDRERQRLARRLRTRSKTPCAKGRRPVTAPGPLRLKRAARKQVEAGGAPSNACPPGVGLPQGGPAPPAALSLGASAPVESAEGGLCGASRGLGNRAVSGYSCRKSVAEVGE